MNDPVIDEIRRVRKLISAEIGPDLSRMADFYRRAEAEFSRPPLTPPTRRKTNSAQGRPPSGETSVSLTE